MPGGFGAFLLLPDALPDANPTLFRTWDRLTGVLDCTALRQMEMWKYFLRKAVKTPAKVWEKTYLLAPQHETSGRIRNCSQTERALTTEPTDRLTEQLRHCFVAKKNTNVWKKKFISVFMVTGNGSDGLDPYCLDPAGSRSGASLRALECGVKISISTGFGALCPP